MLQAEEEQMTQYTQDELANDWEFKIVRSETPAFRKPKVLNQLIEEEAQAGWVMLEKLDDGRVRFKRPRSARAKDAYLPEGVDPYRTRYGAYTSRAALLGVTVGLLLFFVLGIVAFLMAEGIEVQVPWVSIATLIPVILVTLGIVAIFARRRR
jgi:hypothetical protein